MSDKENQTPSTLRRISGITLGTLTGLGIYSAEAYFTYVVAEMIKTGFQTPETLSNAISLGSTLAIAVLGIHDFSQNSLKNTKQILSSGVRAGVAINQAISES